MDALTWIAENRIREAMERGEFDDLPGRGRPLELEDLSGVPEELRAGYILLKSNGFASARLTARKRALRLEDLLDACEDDAPLSGETVTGVPASGVPVPCDDAVSGEAVSAPRTRLRLRLLAGGRGGPRVLPEYLERVAQRLRR